MKLPRVRITVRWLMIAVVLAAIMVGAFEAGRRWERVTYDPLFRSSETTVKVWAGSEGVNSFSPDEPSLLAPDPQTPK